MENNLPFCNFLTNGLFISDKDLTDNLQIKPCCWYKESSNIADYSKTREKWKSISGWTDNCSHCLVLENKKKDSYRAASESYYDLDGNLTMLEIDYSNFCNAACGICGPLSSNLIAKHMRLEGANKIHYPKISQKNFIAAVDQLDISHLKTVRFKGGESLLQKFHLKILEKLKNKDAVIEYFTNGSNFPDEECWAAWKDFKVILIFSIDGIGRKFEYIRTPLKWDQVVSNIDSIRNKNHQNVSYELSYTINPLNLYYHDEIFQFYLKLKKSNPSFKIRMHQCFGDWGLENTTPELRNLFKVKFGRNFSVSKMLDELTFQEDQYMRFVNSIKNHEKRFNLNGAYTFPEIWNLALRNDNRTN